MQIDLATWAAAAGIFSALIGVPAAWLAVSDIRKKTRLGPHASPEIEAQIAKNRMLNCMTHSPMTAAVGIIAGAAGLGAFEIHHDHVHHAAGAASHADNAAHLVNSSHADVAAHADSAGGLPLDAVDADTLSQSADGFHHVIQILASFLS